MLRPGAIYFLFAIFFRLLFFFFLLISLILRDDLSVWRLSMVWYHFPPPEDGPVSNYKQRKMNIQKTTLNRGSEYIFFYASHPVHMLYTCVHTYPEYIAQRFIYNATAAAAVFRSAQTYIIQCEKFILLCTRGAHNII